MKDVNLLAANLTFHKILYYSVKMSLKIVEQKSPKKLTQMMLSPIDVTKCLEVAACVVIGGPPHTTTEAFVIGSYLNRLQNLTHPDFFRAF